MAEEMVIDSSVAGKWFLNDEKDVDLADEIFVAFLAGDIELHAPRNFTYEVCGLLTKACLTKGEVGWRLTKERAIQCVREIFDLPIQISEATEEEGVGALDMAVNYSKVFADMTYIRLAEQLDCQWCTADEKVVESVPTNFPSHRVLALSALREP